MKHVSFKLSFASCGLGDPYTGKIEHSTPACGLGDPYTGEIEHSTPSCGLGDPYTKTYNFLFILILI